MSPAQFLAVLLEDFPRILGQDEPWLRLSGQFMAATIWAARQSGIPRAAYKDHLLKTFDEMWGEDVVFEVKS